MVEGRDPRDLLEDMIEELRLIDEIVNGLDIEDFLDDRASQHAVERCLEILGEAAKTIPSEIVSDHPEVPWSDMAKMRDVLIHAYHRVNPNVVWRTVVEEALPLIPLLEQLLIDLEGHDQPDTTRN